MEKREDILKRYYRGETTVTEEKQLKEAWQQGKFPEEPILGFQGIQVGLPTALTENLHQYIQEKRRHKIRQIGITTGSIAAFFILILSLRGLLPEPGKTQLQLSDNLKKERFENALRVIGNALEERTPPVQKVLYEDHSLIIAVE